jgi:hypothetical protein
MAGPTLVQTGRPNFKLPLPDFCHTAWDPQLARGVMGTPLARERRTTPDLPRIGRWSARVVTVPSG